MYAHGLHGRTVTRAKAQTEASGRKLGYHLRLLGHHQRMARKSRHNGGAQEDVLRAERRRRKGSNPSCSLLKSMGFCLTLTVKSPISLQGEPAHGRQNYHDVLPM